MLGSFLVIMAERVKEQDASPALQELTAQHGRYIHTNNSWGANVMSATNEATRGNGSSQEAHITRMMAMLGRTDYLRWIL